MEFYNRPTPEPNIDPTSDEEYATTVYNGPFLEWADMVADEVNEARGEYDSFNSAHEAFAVLLEELNELKVLVFNKDRTSSANDAMRKELVQIAAMSYCFCRELLS